MSRNLLQWKTPPAALPPSHYVSSSLYRSQAVFDNEVENIFRKTWKFACHESEVAEPGDFRAYEYCKTPIITIRGNDGAIRSFLNICSHRSAILVREPAGNARALRCFFHLWTYDTKGACTSMTRDEAYRECGPDKSEMGLREVKTAVRLGMVFITLDDEAEPLDDYLGPALRTVEECMGTLPLEIFHFHRVVLKTNWKTWHETNMDGYHHWGHAVNRATNLKAQGGFERKWALDKNGHGSIDPVRIDYSNIKGWAERHNVLPGLASGESRTVDLFPNTTIIVRATCVRIDTSTPISPSETLLECRGFGIKGEPVEARRQRVRDHNQHWGPFGRNLPEDLAFVESIGQSNAQGAEYSVVSRQEQMNTMDEGIIRHFYSEWSRRTGLSQNEGPTSIEHIAGVAS